MLLGTLEVSWRGSRKELLLLLLAIIPFSLFVSIQFTMTGLLLIAVGLIRWYYFSWSKWDKSFHYNEYEVLITDACVVIQTNAVTFVLVIQQRPENLSRTYSVKTELELHSLALLRLTEEAYKSFASLSFTCIWISWMPNDLKKILFKMCWSCFGRDSNLNLWVNITLDEKEWEKERYIVVNWCYSTLSRMLFTYKGASTYPYLLTIKIIHGKLHI